jgi:4-amino-4-deoxy-L-arabinose transferase-like glycosyltransferase
LITLSPDIRRQSLIARLLAFLVLMAGVYGQAPIGFDSRFVLFAQEMLRHGPTVFPTTYGQPYADYSVLSTLFIWLLSLPFGTVNAFTAWAPSAIAGAVIVSIPQAKKARYLLPMLPMAAIIAAYPFQVIHGRVFRWLRGLMLGVWLLRFDPRRRCRRRPLFRSLRLFP